MQILSIENYKKIIELELNYEKELLKRIDQDDMIKNKFFVKNRIQNRINIIEGEIVEDIPEEPDDVEEVKEVEQVDEVEEANAVEEVKVRREVTKVEEVKRENKIVEKVVPKEEPKSLNYDEALYAKLKKRAEEYKKANDYFTKIDNQKLVDDSRKKAVEIITALKKMEKGEEVDEFELPIDVNPDYICDCSKAERQKHFNTMIKEFTRMKNEYNEEINLKVEELKKTVKARDIEKNVNFIIN
jgi:hypothetical protein